MAIPEPRVRRPANHEELERNDAQLRQFIREMNEQRDRAREPRRDPFDNF